MFTERFVFIVVQYALTGLAFDSLRFMMYYHMFSEYQRMLLLDVVHFRQSDLNLDGSDNSKIFQDIIKQTQWSSREVSKASTNSNKKNRASTSTRIADFCDAGSLLCFALPFDARFLRVGWSLRQPLRRMTHGNSIPFHSSIGALQSQTN